MLLLLSTAALMSNKKMQKHLYFFCLVSHARHVTPFEPTVKAKSESKEREETVYNLFASYKYSQQRNITSCVMCKQMSNKIPISLKCDNPVVK